MIFPKALKRAEERRERVYGRRGRPRTKPRWPDVKLTRKQQVASNKRVRAYWRQFLARERTKRLLTASVHVWPPRIAGIPPLCRDCGGVMRYIGYFSRPARDYWGCLECPPPWKGDEG